MTARGRRQVTVVVGRILTDGGDQVKRGEDAVGERRAALRRQAGDRAQHRALIVSGSLHRQATVAERHHADLHGRRLALHEILDGGFGGVHARRLHVVGSHAAGNVEREDHRALYARQADDRLRARQRDDQNGQRQQKQQRRDVAENARRARQRPCIKPVPLYCAIIRRRCC